MEQNQNSSIFDSGLDTTSQGHLLSVSKWTRFVSIVAFISMGILLLIVLASGPDVMKSIAALYSLGGSDILTGAIVVVVIVILIFGIWFYFLFRASSLIRRGLDSRNSAELAEGLKALRIYFTFSLVISVLSILSSLAVIF